MKRQCLVEFLSVRLIRQGLSLFVLLTLQLPAQAALDGGPQAVDPMFDTSAQRFSVDVGTETVGDTVDYEPHRAEGGFDPISQRQRYTGAWLGFNWAAMPRLSIDGNAWTRELISKRDTYRLYSLELSARYRLAQRRRGLALSLLGSLSSNLTDRLQKNAYTTYDDVVITEARVQNPVDWRAQAGLLASMDIGARFRMTAYAGAGRAASDYRSFGGELTDGEGCDYEFGVSADSGFVQLQDPCGALQSVRQDFPTSSSFANAYGVDGNTDIRSDILFGQLGLQVLYHRARFNAGIGYHFQRFSRGAMAARLRERNIAPITVNQSVSAWMNYHISPRLTLHGGLEYSVHPMLNRLVLLYTGFTSERFQQDALSVSIGLRIGLF